MKTFIHEILSNGLKRHVATCPSYREAEAAARAAFYPICFEADNRHAGCADLISCDGRHYVIEPERF